MKLENENGMCKMTPLTGEEREVLSAWVAQLDPGAKLAYKGRGPNDGAQDFWTVVLEGAGLRLTLRGECDPDKLLVNDLRNVCFFGRIGGLRLADWAFQGAKLAYVLISAGYCQRCQSSMIDPVSAQWGVCPACAEECQHTLTAEDEPTADFDTGELGADRFCTSCGRVPESIRVQR